MAHLCRMRRGWLGVLLLAAGSMLAILPRPAAAAADEGDGPLVGRWVDKSEFLTTTYAFLPDGRYFLTMQVGETQTHESGTYKLDGKRVTFRSEGQSAEFEMAAADDKLTLTGPTVTFNLVLQPGSRKGIIEEAAKADAEKAKTDAEWAKRFPVGKPASRAHVAAGDVPKDPRPDRVFDGDPTVFATHVSYVRFWNPAVTYRVTDGADPGGGRPQTAMHFLPDGRTYYRDIKYDAPPAPEGTARVGKVVVTEAWGRYRVEKDGKDPKRESIVMETDAGEKLTHGLIDGRRNLLFGETVFGNTLWELYALQKAKGENPELPPVP